MKTYLTLLMLCLSLTLTCRAERVGIVLSGGGAKGIAHVAFLKALEDNDIPVDYVAGTSMGAIVGALYSIGYTPEEMLRLFTSKEFADWSSGTLSRDKEYFVLTNRKNPKMFNINLSPRDSVNNLFSYIPANLIRPIPMNMEFLKLFGPYTLQCGGDFDRLFVPFRCVTSDIYHKHKVVCRDGDLGEAVRQSMSFPLVFKPIERDGVLVYDGGIYDNFPVDVMAGEFHPDVMLGSNVSGPDGKPIPGNVYSQLEDMIIQNNNYDLPDSLGYKIDMPVQQFGVLDFAKAKEIYDIGYKTTVAHLDSIKARVAARRPRSQVQQRRNRFNAATPALDFDTVRVEGADALQANFIKYLFPASEEKPLGVNRVEDSYYRLVSGPNVSDLDPRLEMKDGRNILTLKADLNDKWNIGLGAWLTTATNSMLFLTASYNTLRFNAFDVSLSGWLGQSYAALTGDFKFHPFHHIGTTVELQGVLQRLKYYNDQVLFFNSDNPSFLKDHENYFKVRFIRELSRRSIFFASIGYCYRYSDYYSGEREEAEHLKREKSQFRIWALQAGMESNTLDDQLYPCVGSEYYVKGAFSHQQQRFLPHGEAAGRSFNGGFRSVISARWREYFRLAPMFILGVSVQGAATFGPLSQPYVSEIIQSPDFAPTPSMVNYYNPAFRNPNYAAAGLMPVFTPVKNLQARADLYLFEGIRTVRPGAGESARYGRWLADPQFFGELAVVYNFPFASLSVYGNYMSRPAHNWNFGISFGLLFPAPRFF